MWIAEVIGSVVTTAKTDNMQGLTLRIVRRVSIEATPGESYAVAVDVIGASEGELVLIATGSTARQTQLTDARPVDAVIMGIVETWQVEGQVKYLKGAVPITNS